MDKTTLSTKQIYPVPQEIGETIGHNEILVTGILVMEDAIEYFIVDTIHQRGNTAPVIGKGEKIQITKFINSKPPYNQSTQGVLINKMRPHTKKYIWNLKHIYN